MAVPYTFGSATTSIPLSQLDSNFATTITLGNTAIQLGNTVTTLNNMTLGNVTISSGTSNIQTNVANATGVLLEANGGTGTTTGYYGFKNRIINGAMVIDQRNAGAAVASSYFGYVVDRWSLSQSTTGKLTAQQNQGSVTPPVGFSNYLGVTSQSAFSVGSGDYYTWNQPIEGFNTADLQWGTANAKTITLSAWVYSSLTGTFGGALQNSATTYSYPFTYSIPVANTWTQISITVAGPTAGTWVGATNGTGVNLIIGLGVGSGYSGTANAWASANYKSATGATSVVGTNGATFYITGVQLEKGSTATSFDYRPYGTELQLCQRYYYKVNADTSSSFFSDGQCDQTTTAKGTVQFKVSMRTNPTALEQSGTATDYRVNHSATATTCSSVPTFGVASSNAGGVVFTVASGLTQGRACALQSASTTAYLAWSAEL